MNFIYKLQKSKIAKKLLEVCIMTFVLLYIFLIPSFGESSSTLNALVYIAMFLLTTFVILDCYLFHDFKTNKHLLLIPLFAIFAFLGTAINSHEYRRWASIVLLALSFYIFFLAFKILNNKFTIIHIISIAFFGFSILFIIYYRNEIIHFTDFASGKFRLGDYFDNPNGVAAFEVVGFAAPLYILLFSKKKSRFFHVIPLLLSIIVGISTGSRSYILAISIFVLVFLFFVFKKHRFLYLIVVIVLSIIFALLLQLPFMSTIKGRFEIAFQTLLGKGDKVETSTLTRALWLDYGFFLGFKNGIFGYGTNGFAIFSGVGTYAHNNYAEVICDFGFIGLILFYLPLLLLLIFCLKNKEVDKPLVISFVLYYFIISLSNVLYYKKIYYLILAFLYYLIFCEYKTSVKVKTQKIKKIVFTCDSMGSGGAERVIATLSNELVSRHIEVIIIGVSDSLEPSSFYNLNYSIKYISLNYGLGKKARSLRRIYLLRKAIIKENPDIVISFLPHVNVYTWLALVGSKIPFVVSERNDPNSNPKQLFLRTLKRVAFVAADGCVFQTNDAMNFYKDSIVDKSVVILNPSKISERTTHKTKNNVVLSVGRLTEQKNYFLLLKAFAQANKLLNNSYKLKIYGDGPLKKELLLEVKKLEILDFVSFEGTDNEWNLKEKDDSLFILTSNFEGMPNSLIEALCLGIPCISTNCPCGGPKDLKNLGFNIALINTGDEKALSSAIVETINKYGLDFDLHNMDLCNQFNVVGICDKWLEYLGMCCYEDR